MSYHFTGMGAEDPFKLFETKLTELRQGKAEEAAGTRPPSPLSRIDGACWDAPGFKDCHAIAFRAAQADCEGQGKRDQGACIVPLADHYAMNACPCKKPSIASGITGNNFLVAGIVIVGAWALFMPAKKEKAA